MADADLLALVQRMDDALTRQDLTTLSEQVMTDRVEWILPGRHPLAGRKRGPDEILAYHTLLRKAGVAIEPTVVDAIDGDTVAKLQHVTGSAAGVTLDSMELLVYRIEGGRISRIEAFIGDQHPVDLFYWAAFRLKPVPQCVAE